MRTLLLGFAAAAAAAVAAAPAAGQSGGAGDALGGTQFSEGSSVAQHPDGRRDDRRHRRHRRGGDTVVVMDWNGGEWARYNNQSWRSESYNDWWHDRPDRAYPRWMQNNQKCERIWWGGGGWRC